MARKTARLFDEYLAAAARAGDRGAFGRLAERWQPMLLAHAWRLMGEAEAARDVVQDAWVDIARGPVAAFQNQRRERARLAKRAKSL